MRRWLGIFFIPLAARLLAVDYCSDPSTIDFFPLNETTTAGACHPGTYDFKATGAVSYGQCSTGGPAVAMLFSPDNQNFSVNYLASSALPIALFRGASFTIQFDFQADFIPPPFSPAVFPAGNPFTVWGGGVNVDPMGGTTPMMAIYTDGFGLMEWITNWGPTSVPGNFIRVVTGEGELVAGRSQRIGLVSDGTGFSIFVDGALAGGPVQGVPASLPTGNVELAPINPNGLTYFRNALFSNLAMAPGSVATGPCTSMTPTFACTVSVLKPPDATVGADHTVIETCTTVATPAPTPTQTADCPKIILRPPDATFGAPHTVIQTCTAGPHQSSTTSSTFTPTQPDTATSTVATTPTMTPTQTATMTPTGCPASAYHAPVSDYKQIGQTWSGILLDSTKDTSNTIGNYGCILTCFSMVAGEDPGKLNATYNSITVPASMVFLQDGSGQILFIRAVAQTGWASSENESADITSIEQALKLGEIPIVHVLRNSSSKVDENGNPVQHDHFVIATGEDFSTNPNASNPNCRITINDPGANQALYKYLDAYDSNGQQVVDMRVLYP